jgi:hypothetical protein
LYELGRGGKLKVDNGSNQVEALPKAPASISVTLCQEQKILLSQSG